MHLLTPPYLSDKDTSWAIEQIQATVWRYMVTQGQGATIKSNFVIHYKELNAKTNSMKIKNTDRVREFIKRKSFSYNLEAKHLLKNIG